MEIIREYYNINKQTVDKRSDLTFVELRIPVQNKEKSNGRTPSIGDPPTVFIDLIY